jgi:hypothetical protein
MLCHPKTQEIRVQFALTPHPPIPLLYELLISLYTPYATVTRINYMYMDTDKLRVCYDVSPPVTTPTTFCLATGANKFHENGMPRLLSALSTKHALTLTHTHSLTLHIHTCTCTIYVHMSITGIAKYYTLILAMEQSTLASTPERYILHVL